MSRVEELFTDSGSVVVDDAPATTFALTMPKIALQYVALNAKAIIPSRDVMPILKYVQLRATDTSLTAVTTDTELALISTITHRVTVEVPGTIVLPVARLLDILRAAATGEVRITATATRCRITVARTTWTLNIPSGADFPALPTLADAVTHTIGSRGFFDALQNVRYAADGASRPGLCAVEIRDGVATASDGTRFAQCGVAGWDLTEPVILPLPAVDRLLKLSLRDYSGEIELSILDRHYAIHSGDELFIITKTLHPFPDMSATLLRPALENRHILTVPFAEFGQALNRVRITADPDHHGIALHLSKGQLQVVSRDQHGNATTDEMPCQWTGPARTLTVHHKHLCVLFFTMEEIVAGQCAGYEDGLQLWLGEDSRTRRSPILARDGATVAVIQQMHLDWAGQ